MHGNGNKYLDNLYDFPLTDERHLTEVEDWCTVYSVVGEDRGSRRLTLQ
jgi:hypothetical protein